LVIQKGISAIMTTTLFKRFMDWFSPDPNDKKIFALVYCGDLGTTFIDGKMTDGMIFLTSVMAVNVEQAGDLMAEELTTRFGEQLGRRLLMDMAFFQISDRLYL